MKKTIILLIMIMTSLLTKASVFSGGFYHADPDAWFDKEPYFACSHIAVNYYGQPMYLSNVSVVINDTDVYTFPYNWEYGTYIVVDNSTVKFSSGDTVTIYVGNQNVGTWTYNASLKLPDIKLRGGGKLLKSIWKYVKKIR